MQGLDLSVIHIFYVFGAR